MEAKFIHSSWLQHPPQRFGSLQCELGVKVRSPDRGARAAAVKAEGKHKGPAGEMGCKGPAP